MDEAWLDLTLAYLRIVSMAEPFWVLVSILIPEKEDMSLGLENFRKFNKIFLIVVVDKNWYVAPRPI